VVARLVGEPVAGSICQVRTVIATSTGTVDLLDREPAQREGIAGGDRERDGQRAGGGEREADGVDCRPIGSDTIGVDDAAADRAATDLAAEAPIGR